MNNINETPTPNRPRSDTIDLNDHSLQVDISDALSERDRVKFTVHTKVNVSYFFLKIIWILIFIYFL